MGGGHTVRSGKGGCVEMCLLTKLVVEEKEKALVGGQYWDQRRDEGRHP